MQSTVLLIRPALQMETSFSLFLIISLIFAVSAANDGGAVVQQQQLWCVAKNNAEDTALQQALDWACGPGAADCGPIQQGGPCYDTADLIGMASYAFNDYCLKHGMTDETCNFGNTAALTALDPSHEKCKYPSSSYSARNSTTPSTAGILPGSENLSGCGQLGVMWVWRSITLNLFLAIFMVLQ